MAREEEQNRVLVVAQDALAAQPRGDPVAQALHVREALHPGRCPGTALRGCDAFEAAVEDGFPQGALIGEVDHGLLGVVDADPVMDAEFGQQRSAERETVHRRLGLQRTLVVPQREQHELLVRMEFGSALHRWLP